MIGVCALLAIDGEPESAEFAKMGVTPEAQGSGVGQALIAAAIAQAEHDGQTRLILYSNTRLAKAIALYRRFGFIDAPLLDAERLRYRRADIKLIREAAR